MNTFVSVIRDLLGEAYAGRAQAPTWFIDHGAHSGVLGTLESIDASDASRATVSGGSSIAAHANHLRWSLRMTNAMMRGQPASRDWAESWAVRRVDDAAWTRLRAELKREYEQLLEALPNGFDGSRHRLERRGTRGARGVSPRRDPADDAFSAPESVMVAVLESPSKPERRHTAGHATSRGHHRLRQHLGHVLPDLQQVP